MCHAHCTLRVKFRDLIENNIMFQLIKDPTYIAANYQSLLDLIITDSPGYILDSGVGNPIGDPCHCYIYCKLHIAYPKDSKFKKSIWHYKNANFPDLNTALLNCPWDVLDIFDDVDDMTDYFIKLYLETCKQFVPNRNITICPTDKPWMTSAIKAKLRERNKWHRRLKMSGCDHHLELFRLKRAEANEAINQAKARHYESIKEKLSDPNIGNKEYWKLLKLLYGSKIDSGIPSIIDGENVYATSKAKAELFNNHFVEKSTLPTDLPGLPPLHVCDSQLAIFVISEEEVKKSLSSLNVSKANGCDNISNKLLKNTASSISKPLAKLFNYSLASGKFPSVWKYANVTPVFKKNDKQNKSNYRPISLLSNIGKVFERVIFNHLYKYCQDNNLLTWRNSGYKPLDSSINQLIYISHKIYQSLERGEDVCYVSLDASSAFDRVWHEGLLFKLKSKGINGKLLEWFSSYLTNRRQRVVIKGQASRWAEILAGVPQGSILGPLLFLIYIDDIVNDIECNDTSTLETISDPILSFDKINRDLTRLYIWSNQWLVSFNPTKTAYITFSKKLIRQNYPDLFLGGEKLKQVSTHKQLGVIFNDKMTFDNHIRENCTKAMKRVTILKRLNTSLPRTSKLVVYTAFIRPILEFGWQLYDNSTQEQLDTLERVQREALLLVTGAYKKTSHVSLLKEVGLPLLSKRRNMQKILFMFKFSQNDLPVYLNREIPDMVDSVSEYNLRNKTNIHMPKSKKNYFLKSFIPSSIKIWNDSNADIRQSANLTSLKDKLLSVYGNKSYSMFLFGDGRGAVNHSRIRMGLSALNAHRKKYHFIAEGKCDQCNFRSENTEHFFLFCPAYAAQRQQLFRELRRNVPDTIEPLMEFSTNRRKANELTLILVSGSGDQIVDTQIFKSVQIFIENTSRF